MSKVIAVDPGKYKCGIVFADLEMKLVNEAIVIKTDMLSNYIKKIFQNHYDLTILIGNGTSSKKLITLLSGFEYRIISVEEKNSTYRAKKRYFELFPLIGIKSFLPREIFIINKNLDALAALIIMEDYYKFKFVFSKKVCTKTWQK